MCAPRRVSFAKDCRYTINKCGGKGKTSQGKGTNIKDGDTKKKGVNHNCNEMDNLLANFRRRKRDTMRVVEVTCIA